MERTWSLAPPRTPIDRPANSRCPCTGFVVPVACPATTSPVAAARNGSEPISQQHGYSERMPPLERVVVAPQILAGKPVIRGKRLAVEFIFQLPAAG